MLDLIIRNARLAPRLAPRLALGPAGQGHAGGGPELVDIGFRDGRIAAIEPGIVAEAPDHDAEGCLCCAGLVETHIHLDKSRIVDRCQPEPSRSQPDHMRRVQAVKASFTLEDIYERAKATLES